jgi:hypothetical protein
MLENIVISIVILAMFCVWVWLITPGVQAHHNQRKWVQQQMEKDDLQKMQK